MVGVRVMVAVFVMVGVLVMVAVFVWLAVEEGDGVGVLEAVMEGVAEKCKAVSVAATLVWVIAGAVKRVQAESSRERNGKVNKHLIILPILVHFSEECSGLSVLLVLKRSFLTWYTLDQFWIFVGRIKVNNL